MTVNHKTFGTMCEICFCQVTLDDCAIDDDGVKWDVHTGACAKQAGIHEPIVRVIHKCKYDEE